MAGPAAEAYIIMRADGTLLPRDVKDFAGDAGEAAAKDFSDEWDKELGQRQEKSLKEFRSKINKALDDPRLFASLRRAGESSDQTFKRLGETFEDLSEKGLVSRGVMERFIRSFEDYQNIEKADSKIGTLGRSIRELTMEQRKIFDADVKRAMTSYDNDWSKIVKKFGSVEDTSRALRARLSELTEENSDFRDEAEQTVQAFDVWVDRTRRLTQEQERQSTSTAKLADGVRNLGEAQRSAFDADILRVMRGYGDQWDNIVKKQGGVEATSRALTARMRELREETGDFGDVADEINQSFDRWITKQSELESASKKAADETVSGQRRMSKSTSKLQRDLDRLKGAADETFDSLIVKARTSGSWSELNHHVNDAADTLDHVRTRAERLEATTEALSNRMRHLRDNGELTDETFQEVTDSFEEYRREQQRIIDSTSEMSLQQERARVINKAVARTVREGHGDRDKFILQLGGIGDGVGRAFGRGGRNDVLHFFGGIIGGITKFALQGPAKLFMGVSDSVKIFRGSFEQLTKSVADGGAGMAKVPAMFSSMGSAASAAIPAIAGGIPVLIGVAAAAGALASLISLLVGNLVILGQAIWLSVAAPIAAAIPAIVAFGAGAVVAGGAIYKWSQQSSAFKSAMSGISDELDKLAVKITPAMDGLSRLFGKAGQSMVQSFGGAVTRVLNDLYKRLDDPAMDKFYRAWGESMPRAFESLGKAATGFITGLTAFFVPILPYAERLSDAIGRAADRFSEWATSASGQNEIADWMETAWEVAVDLWSGLRDISSALGNIFGMATGQGATFAAWVRDIGERFEKWTESEKGREAISQWLDDAADLGRDLGTIIGKLADAFDSLDSKEGRDSLSAFATLFEHVASAAQLAAHVVNGINWVSGGGMKEAAEEANMLQEALGKVGKGDLGGALKTVTEGWKGDLLDAYNKSADLWGVDRAGSFSEAVSDSADRVKGIFSDLGDWISGTGSGIKSALSDLFDIDWSGVWEDIKSGISDLVERAKGWLESKGSEIGEKVKGWFDIDWSGVLDSFMGFLGGMARQAGLGIGLVIGFFLKLPGRIGGALSEAWDAISTWTSDTWDSFSTWASEVPGRIREGLSSAKDAISTWASETWDSFSTWASELPGRIGDGLSDALESVKTWATDMKDAVVGWFEDIEWGQVWEDVKSGISEGLQGIWEWLKEQGKMLFDQFIQGIKDGLGIASPSQKMIELMGYVGEGILQGLLAIPGLIGEAVSGLFKPLIDGAMELPGKVTNALSTLGSTIWTALSGVGMTIGTTVSGWWTTISSNLMSWGGRAASALSGFVMGIISTLGTVAGRIGTTVSGWWTSISGALMSWGGRAASALSGFITSVISSITSVGSRIGTAVSGWWSSIGSTLSSWGGKAASALSSFGSSVRSSFDSAKTAATQKAGELVDSARGKLSEMGSKAGSALTSLGTNVKTKFNSAKTTATTTASSLVEGARSKLSAMGGKASSALSNLSSNVKSKFNSAKSSATTTASSLVSSARSTLSRMGSQASSALSNLASNVKSRFNTAKSNATSTASSLVSSARSALSRMGSSAASALSNVAGRVRSAFNSAKNAAVSVAGSMISSARSRLSGMAGAVGSALSGVTSAITRPFQAAKDAVNRILGQIRGLASTARSIGGSLRGKIPGFAKGGTVFGNQIARVGETGPEAIVPLNRPLHQVDPSVRWLSAIAQGKGGGGGGGTTIQSGAIQVVTPYANPELVANRVLDDLVANL